MFEVLSEKFKLQPNETILLLQYCKLIGDQNEKAKEWMGCNTIETNDSGCKKDRRLKLQLINGINDDDIMTEIRRQLTAIKKTNEITNKQLLAWARRVEA